MELGTEESLSRKGSSRPGQTLGRKWRPPARPTLRPFPLPSHPQPLSPECPPGLRARSSAWQNRGRRRRPGAEGRGRGASQTINRRWSRRWTPAKSTFRASTRFPLTKRPPRRKRGAGAARAASLLPLLPSEHSFPPEAVCPGSGRRRETKRQRVWLTT